MVGWVVVAVAAVLLPAAPAAGQFWGGRPNRMNLTVNGKQLRTWAQRTKNVLPTANLVVAGSNAQGKIAMVNVTLRPFARPGRPPQVLYWQSAVQGPWQVPLGLEAGVVYSVEVRGYDANGLQIVSLPKDQQSQVWVTWAGGPVVPPPTVPGHGGYGQGFRGSLSDDFSRGLGNWDVSRVRGRVDRGTLRFAVQVGEMLELKTPLPMEDVVVEFDGYTDSNGFTIALVSPAARRPEYRAVIGAAGNTLSALHAGPDSRRVSPLVEGKAFTPGKWNRYKLVRIGNTLQAWCDGRQIAAANVTTRIAGTGQLQISSYKSNLAIDNLRVYTRGGAVQPPKPPRPPRVDPPRRLPVNFPTALGRPNAISDELFVLCLFDCVLESPPSPKYLAQYTQALKAGTSRKSVTEAFILGKAYAQRRTTDPAFIRDAFQAVLGREPTARERVQWSGALSRGGKGRKVLIDALFATPEYRQLMANPGVPSGVKPPPPPAGVQARILMSRVYMAGGGARWSDDGRSIVYASARSGLVRVDPRTGARERVNPINPDPPFAGVPAARMSAMATDPMLVGNLAIYQMPGTFPAPHQFMQVFYSVPLSGGVKPTEVMQLDRRHLLQPLAAIASRGRIECLLQQRITKNYRLMVKYGRKNPRAWGDLPPGTRSIGVSRDWQTHALLSSTHRPNERLRLWHRSRGFIGQLPDMGPVTWARFSRDGKYLALRRYDKRMKESLVIVEVANPTRVRIVHAGRKEYRPVGWSPDNRHLAVISADAKHLDSLQIMNTGVR
jgi:hypothetical protein